MLPASDEHGDDLPLRAGVRDHVSRLFRFAIVSGIGLALDLLLFLTFVSIGTMAFVANFLSSSAAVTFVYFASVHRVFRYNGQFIATMFAAYLLYQLCGILLGSWAVAFLIDRGFIPAAAKVLILPVTFGANYLFMWWLTSNTQRWIRAR